MFEKNICINIAYLDDRHKEIRHQIWSQNTIFFQWTYFCRNMNACSFHKGNNIGLSLYLPINELHHFCLIIENRRRAIIYLPYSFLYLRSILLLHMCACVCAQEQTSLNTIMSLLHMKWFILDNKRIWQYNQCSLFNNEGIT